MLIHVRIFHHGVETLLAACDEGLLGKKYREGEMILDIKESFYGGDLVEKMSLKDHIKEASIINLVGETCVRAAVDMGMGSEEDIIEVEGIPHLQVVRM
ncbi:MAG: DUF424 family protein [Thermoplasmata archaeon]